MGLVVTDGDVDGTTEPLIGDRDGLNVGVALGPTIADGRIVGITK